MIPPDLRSLIETWRKAEAYGDQAWVEGRQRTLKYCADELEALLSSRLEAGEATAPAEDGRLSAHVARYMREQMAMPDADSDQEQNWIAGHMHTFAAQVLSQAARVEAPVPCANCGETGHPTARCGNANAVGGFLD